MNETLIRVAVRNAQLGDVDGYTEINSLPKTLRVYVWRFSPHRPTRVEVDVVQYGDTLIEPPLVVAWRQELKPCTSLREVKKLENGRPVYGPPGPHAKLQIVCLCGERRFLPLNSRHQVTQCRVCAEVTKRRTKAVRQFYRLRRSSCSARAHTNTRSTSERSTSIGSRQSSTTSVS